MGAEDPRSDPGYQSSYSESYSGQEPAAKDNYGNDRYVAYKERYAYQNPTGRDEYGNPTYNWWFTINYLFR